MKIEKNGLSRVITNNHGEGVDGKKHVGEGGEGEGDGEGVVGKVSEVDEGEVVDGKGEVGEGVVGKSEVIKVLKIVKVEY